MKSSLVLMYLYTELHDEVLSWVREKEEQTDVMVNYAKSLNRDTLSFSQ